ncbi:MAG: AAA family ATPase [Piscirickettsiaceae bacterium]|nr:AAA family ATPase [Piscirickettsiaceae bacterium]
MNQNEGVGKTTTTINLGHALALAGKRVTVLDMDPQGHVAIAYGLDKKQAGLDHVLLDDRAIGDVAIMARENLEVVLAGEYLADYENVLEGGASRGYKLRLAIENSALKERDFVLIDCSSASGLLGINALFAADEVMMPISSNYLSLQGLSKMMRIFKRAEALSGRSIKLWLVSTRMNLHRRLAHEVRRRVLTCFPGRVLKTVIRENYALAEALGFGKTIFDYKQASTGAEDYQALAQDLLLGRIA